MTDKHVEDTVTFLIINRTAFSRKRPVQIEFGPEWDTLHITTPRDLTPEGRRAFLRKQQRPRIDLYKAIGNPVHMNATQCPWFYVDITEGMDLESLETFVDVDHYRSKYREISDQQVFLQRCHNLRELQISVSDPLLFSLVVENQSTRVSSKLQELDIRLCYGSVPLEDAMEAYGQSLRNVKISVDAPIGYGDPSKPLVFGDWTLPFVNTIDIEVHSKAVVCIKDFSHCHRLEELSVTFADKTRSPIISKHICLPAHRAPVWKKLSHLKTLKLYGGAAFQFDFDSLDHCSDLETLILDTCLEEDRSVFVPEYQASFCHQIGSHVLSNNELVAFDQTGQQCKCHRHFPKLRTLILKGSPSSAFCLTWLQGCPALETIELAAHGMVGFKFLLCSCNTCILSSKEPQTEIRPATLQIQPCIESKLTSIKIAGPCEFSGKALLTLLTIYAPNVIELHMDMIRNNPGTSKLDVASHGGRILEVLKNAEYINHIRDQREPTRVRSDKFKYFSCAYSLPKGDKNKLGLLFINHCEMDKYLDAGKVVFNMNTQCYIRKQDKM
ncbi:hypothetical protein BGZ74_006639 [Mortierella antarctica]|nr:hypothetical protein BGZ74_006639 [Mortierella antarctica]